MSFISVLFSVSCLALVANALTDIDHFENFIRTYDRNYADEHEKQTRFEIFKENLAKINRLNENSNHAVYEITQFADLTNEEFKSKFTCFNVRSRDSGLNEDEPSCKELFDEDIKYNDAPESFDWRDHEAVTPIKDQKFCGSCYAFSAIGNIEGQYAIKNKELVGLSEQQIVDCDKVNGGCMGGRMDDAIRSLINQGGSMSEADYPYKGRVNKCSFDANKVKVKINDCIGYNLTSQEKVKQLLYHTGPLVVGVKGEPLSNYGKGIISDEECNVGDLNHGVLLVGYGSEDGMPFWIVKNSWGKVFGEEGYYRMFRGEGAHSCGILIDFLVTAIVA